MSPAAESTQAVDPWSDDAPAIAGTQQFQGDGDCFSLSVLDGNLIFEIDRVRFERGDLWGTLTVRTGLSGARTFEGVLCEGTINLSSVETRARRARVFADLARCPQIDFHRLLESFSVRVHAAVRDGDPAVDLRAVPRATSVDSVVIDGITIYQNLPTCLFGKGGDGKSIIALYIAGQAAKRGLRVGYVDWELDAGNTRDRFEREHDTSMPELTYISCTRPLCVEVDRIRRLRRQHDLDFLVYDSVGFASHGRPEDAEVALRYPQCVRQIGVGSLHIAHVNKSDDGDKQPFGSTFWHNFFRSTWNLKKSESTGPHELIVACYNRKANLGPQLPSVGFRLEFGTERTLVRTIDIAKVDDLAPGLPLWCRIKSALKEGPPRTVAQLAEELGEKPDSIEKAIKRKSEGPKALFTRVDGTGGAKRIALVERRYA
jgi:hypothetical protein